LKVVLLNAAAAEFTLMLLWAGSASADLAVREVQIASRAPKSRVPEVTARGRFLAPQAISAVDVSADGKFITVGTMAFSHDANVWQLAPDGRVIAKRHFPPWAPMQVATLTGGRALAVGLAYSRITSPDPTVWFGRSEELLATKLNDELAEADSQDGQIARLRPGGGDWRTGWFASSLGGAVRKWSGLGLQATPVVSRRRRASPRVALRAKKSAPDGPRDAHGCKR
jgi:hypothetical protein